jgi:HK97 family phage major capsid protein
MSDHIQPPKDGVRAMPPGSMTGDGKTLFGRLAPANEWAEIRSVREGHFLERHAPGAFTKTFKETTPKILFQHGRDNQLGDRIIAEPIELGEDEVGPYYRAELLDGLDPLLVEGLKRSLYGSSHTFQVVREDKMVYPKEPTAWNPDMLPERTIREVRAPEMGPVTWPAYLGSATSARSLSDEFALSDVAAQPDRLADLVSYVSPPAPSADAEAQPHLDPERRDDPPPAPPDTAPIEAPQDPPEGGSLSTRKETTPVDYISREDKVSRVKELESAIEARADEFTGVFPEDVQAKDDADIAERDQLIRDIAAVDARKERIASFTSSESRTESATYSAPAVIRTKSIEDIYDIRAVDRAASTPEDRAQKLRDNAMRSLDSSSLPAASAVDGLSRFIDREMGDEDEDGRLHQEATRRILLTGSPAYKRAFAKYLKNGNERAWTPEESRAAALAVTGTTTTGGYAVPYVFDPTFIRIGAHTSVNPYRQACRVETISGGNNWRAVTATAITAKWDTEAAASVEGGPTIGQPTFTVQRADAFATVSIETLQDRPDVTEELSGLFAEAKDTLEENSFTLGVGTTVYPQGMFLSGAFTVQSTATDNTTVLLDFTVLEAALPLRHRANAAFFMSRSTQRQLELLDTTGYYFKRPGQLFAMNKAELPAANPTGNTGTQLLGYPVWEVPSAVSTLSTDQAVIAVLCDPKNYVVVDRIGMNVEVVPTMLNGATPSFPTGQRGIYCYWRSTARVLNADGGRQLDVN